MEDLMVCIVGVSSENTPVPGGLLCDVRGIIKWPGQAHLWWSVWILKSTVYCLRFYKGCKVKE